MIGGLIAPQTEVDTRYWRPAGKSTARLTSFGSGVPGKVLEVEVTIYDRKSEGVRIQAEDTTREATEDTTREATEDTTRGATEL